MLQSTIRMSKTSKLDNIRSWSLQAIDTCPGSIDQVNGGLVAACSGCYATTGAYVWSTTKAPRLANQEDWKRDSWVDDMVQELRKDKYLRWFDSGDMYSLKLARKMYQVMAATPQVKHWLPTRMAKFAKFQPILEAMQALPNVMVRFSSDSITGEFDQRHGSVIFPASEAVPHGAKLCTAYQTEGKCSGCRACYDKSVAVIAYPQHGRKMAKVFKLTLVK